MDRAKNASCWCLGSGSQRSWTQLSSICPQRLIQGRWWRGGLETISTSFPRTENLTPTKEVMLLLGLVRSSVTVVSARSLPGGSVPPGVTSSCCSKPGNPWEGRSWQASPAQGSGAQGCLLLASTHSPGGIPCCCLDSSCHSGMTPMGPERGQPDRERKATRGSIGACGLSKIVVVPLPAWN